MCMYRASHPTLLRISPQERKHQFSEGVDCAEFSLSVMEDNWGSLWVPHRGIYTYTYISTDAHIHWQVGRVDLSSLLPVYGDLSDRKNDGRSRDLRGNMLTFESEDRGKKRDLWTVFSLKDVLSYWR